MANLTKKVLGIAGTAMVFAGMSFGQFNNCSAPTTNVPPILDRWEGTTELVSDITIACPAGSTLSGAAVKLQMSLPITSPVLGAGPGSDAVIRIVDAANTGNNQVVQGVPVAGSPTNLIFTGVNFPPEAFTVTFSNIRVNASTAANGTSNIAVTETFFILNLGTEVYNLQPAATVGYVQTGFSAPALTIFPPGFSNPAQYVICTANPANNAGQSFSITQSTLFGGALKTQTPGAFTITNGEAGSYTTAPYGAATHGTRIQLVFSSVAAGETIYLPNTVTAFTSNVADAVTLVLTQNVTGPNKPFPGSSIGATGTPAGTVGFTPASGATTVTAVYEATQADNTKQTETWTIAGFITAKANFASASVPAVVLTVGLAPQAGTGVTDIPAFTTNYSPINLSAFNLCQTTLLFPFVAAGTAAAPGFDTGIAISNTGMDPYAAGTGAIGSPGACTFNLYGTNAPTPAAVATALAANSPGYPANGIIQPGTSAAFSLANQNIAPGFTGYIVAQCQFLYAHGFAYLTYGGDTAVTTSEMAMGYLAEVLANNRSNIGAGPEGVTF